jgi:hypothetical protein
MCLGIKFLPHTIYAYFNNVQILFVFFFLPASMAKLQLFLGNQKILPRGITATEVQAFRLKICAGLYGSQFLFGGRSRTLDGGWCAHFPIVISQK